ncbi:hypothetical protein MUK42_01894 [Musa troglodytarum]|uniref:Uncharacterized protein n=1 Tax=Musa troglodytarum TaxID=320322 RepID=A0A9E7FR07_9LILI|nr:hypothetical protein MUK42_01894 [Musa troglodytarum]
MSSAVEAKEEGGGGRESIYGNRGSKGEGGAGIHRWQRRGSFHRWKPKKQGGRGWESADDSGEEASADGIRVGEAEGAGINRQQQRKYGGGDGNPPTAAGRKYQPKKQGEEAGNRRRQQRGSFRRRKQKKQEGGGRNSPTTAERKLPLMEAEETAGGEGGWVESMGWGRRREAGICRR